jgi:hypothetical protein
MSEPLEEFPDLEVNIDIGTGAGTYRVELRFNDPSNPVERPRVTGEAAFSLAALLPFEADPKRYGAELAKALLPPGSSTLAEYRDVRKITEARAEPLRVRLSIGTGAHEPHLFRWELLSDLDDGAFLFTSPRVMFSRFLASSDFRKVELRPKSELKALVAVSAPADVAKLGLAEVDFAKQTAVAMTNLKGMEVTTLGGEGNPVTQESLMRSLRELQPDILYLVCHGSFKTAPALVLQKDDGSAATASGASIADLIDDLPVQPRLVVLASCESGGAGVASDGKSEAFQNALAPLLAKAGVGSVIAMRGKISMDTVTSVMPVFFEELSSDGRVDRALAVARGAAFAAKREDFWMLTLYMSLSEGRIWEEPAVAPLPPKPSNAGLLWLLLPTALIATLVVISMSYPVPATVEITATVNQLKLQTIAGDAQVLLAQSPVTSLGLTGLQEFRFHPAKLWIANPSKLDKSNEYPEDAWQEVPNLSEFVLRDSPAQDQLISIEPWLDEGNSGSIRVGPIYATGLSRVTLSTPGRLLLSLRLVGTPEKGSLQLPKRFRLHIQGGTTQPALPYLGSVDLRVERTDESKLVDLKPAPQPTGTTMQLVFEEGKELPLLDGNGLEVVQLEFVRQGKLTPEPESALTGPGKIQFAGHPEAVDVAAKDVLELGELRDFHIANADLFLQGDEQTSLRLKLTGTAGSLRSGPAGLAEERRLSLFDVARHDQQMVALFVILLLWLAPTLIAGRNFLRKRSARHDGGQLH